MCIHTADNRPASSVRDLNPWGNSLFERLFDCGWDLDPAANPPTRMTRRYVLRPS